MQNYSGTRLATGLHRRFSLRFFSEGRRRLSQAIYKFLLPWWSKFECMQQRFLNNVSPGKQGLFESQKKIGGYRPSFRETIILKDILMQGILFLIISEKCVILILFWISMNPVKIFFKEGTT